MCSWACFAALLLKAFVAMYKEVLVTCLFFLQGPYQVFFELNVF